MANYKVEITGINTSNLKALSHEENIQLFEKMHDGDNKAKEELIKGNLKLVLAVLRSFSNKNVNMDDLFQIGVIGLIKAIDNFDVSYNLKLSTYAIPLIVGEVKKYLRDNMQIRVSRSIKENAYKIIAFKESYFNEYGKECPIELISKSLNLSEFEITSALSSLYEPVSIFEPIYNDGGDTIYLFDQIADNKEENIDKDLYISLNNALKKVKKKDKDILIDRFINGKTQSEIALEMNISQAQVSRLEKGALERVRRLVK